MNRTPEHDGSHDFDFLFGRWHIHNHFLRKRLANSDDWIDFEATGECRPALGGSGNVDEFKTDHWSSFVGLSLRFYNPQTEQWSIYWVDTRDHVLLPPTIGSFTGGIGTFEGTEEHRGKLIRVRFVWSRVTPTSAQWEQFFSPDDGQTWESNWIMEFTRSDE